MAAQDWHYGRANNGIGGSGDAGPAAKLDNVESWEKSYFANVNGYLQYEIIEGLNVKTVLGGDIRDHQRILIDYLVMILERELLKPS